MQPPEQYIWKLYLSSPPKHFFLLFRLFPSRKSLPQVMMSDNASMYMSAAKELTKLLQSNELATSLGIQGVYPKEGPMVWGILEEDDTANQPLLEEGLR